MDNYKFIKKLIKYEILNGEESGIFEKEDVLEKYLYGKCDSLVQMLFLLNDKCGRRIRLEDKTDNTIHYIYEDEDGIYYDITGKYETLEDLIENSQLFEFFEDVQISELEFSDYTLDNMEDFYLDIVTEIKG